MSENQKKPATDRPLTDSETRHFHEQLKEQTFAELVEWAAWAEGIIPELYEQIQIRDARIAQLRRRLRDLEAAAKTK